VHSWIYFANDPVLKRTILKLVEILLEYFFMCLFTHEFKRERFYRWLLGSLHEDI
jgi:hypothetical protein